MGMVEPAICWSEVVNKVASDKEFDNMWINFDFVDFPPETCEGNDFVGDWSQRLGPIPSDDLLIGTQIIDPSHILPHKAPMHNDEKYKPKVEKSDMISTQNTCSVRSFFPDNPKRKRSKLVTSSRLGSPWFSIKLASQKNSNANKNKERVKRYSSRKTEYPLQVPNIVDRQNGSSVHTSFAAKKCTHCEVTKTPQWREGPLGPKTLCNACGVRYRSGRLFPEYRPAVSPTFVPSLHSNSHKKVVEMRSKDTQTGIYMFHQ